MGIKEIFTKEKQDNIHRIIIFQTIKNMMNLTIKMKTPIKKMDKRGEIRIEHQIENTINK